MVDCEKCSNFARMNLQMFRYITLSVVLTAALTLLSACSDSDDAPTTAAPAEAAPQEVHFNANVWQVMQGNRASTYDSQPAIQAETKGFKCYAYVDGSTDLYIDGSTVKYVTDHWEFQDGKHYWPMTGALNFFALMPSDLSGTCCSYSSYTEDAPIVTCADLPVTFTRGIDTTQELILAYAAQQDKAGTNSTLQPTPGQVALTFKHPFARVRFKLSAESDGYVVVNRITIPAICRDGTCTFNGASPQSFTWSSLADNDEGIVISAPSAGQQATDDDAYYLVIPNNYGTKTLTINGTWTDWSNVTKDLSTSVTLNWEPGYSYTYTLTVTKYALKVETTNTYTEQW